MNARIKTDLYAKKLRAAIAEESKRHEESLKEYAASVESYKADLLKHVRSVVVKRIEKIRPGRKVDRYGRMRDSLDLGTLMSGGPDYPEYPSTKRLGKLKKRLHFVAIAAPETISIDEGDDLIPDVGCDE